MSEPGGSHAPGDDPGARLREQYRRQVLASIGGWSGTVVAAVPTVVFVVVNATSGLHWAIVAAVGSAVVLSCYRLVRHQPVQQALSGLLGVLVASLIAARTGHAKGYFLVGIWSSFLYAGAFTLSLAVRRPVVGLIWEFLDPTSAGEQVPWYRRRPLLLAYDLATACSSRCSSTTRPAGSRSRVSLWATRSTSPRSGSGSGWSLAPGAGCQRPSRR